MQGWTSSISRISRSTGTKRKSRNLQYGSQEGPKLARLALTGASFTQKANRLEIDQLRLSQGNVSLSRGADGQLSIQSLLVPQGKS
ncbi:MAG: hypothetical protein NTY86_02485 [Deltaproteobacteria bacterium]|nr:hypothetical protein [Deltaproteobacteria bacterium]